MPNNKASRIVHKAGLNDIYNKILDKITEDKTKVISTERFLTKVDKTSATSWTLNQVPNST